MVEDSVLWNDVTIESGARVRHAVFGDGVRVPAGELIERAVVVRADKVSKVERGDIVGENLIVRI